MRPPRFGRVQIVGSSAPCTEAVEKKLVGEGVEAARFEQRIVSRDDHEVYFAVLEWDHTRCP
jgi:hypothetical protein